MSETTLLKVINSHCVCVSHDHRYAYFEEYSFTERTNFTNKIITVTYVAGSFSTTAKNSEQLKVNAIDKANIKGTEERITQQEKITIVYSHKEEEREYLKYIKFLQFKKVLEPTIEQFEVEELQGVSGLKAIRIKVLNTISKNPNHQYTYEELLEELD